MFKQTIERTAVPFLLVTFLMTLAAGAVAAPQWEYYAEQAFQGRENLAVQALRVRALAMPGAAFQPYLQLGHELQTAPAAANGLDAGASYLYGGPGLRLKLGKISLLGEARARVFYSSFKAGTAPSAADLRALAVYGDFFQTADWVLSFSGFVEPYTELLYSSSDSHNLSLSGHLRVGTRLRVSNSFNIDAMLEPYAALDRMRHYYNNRIGLRPGLRVTIGTPELSVGILASYVLNHDFARGDREPNPYKGQSGPRVLAVLGGTL